MRSYLEKKSEPTLGKLQSIAEANHVSVAWLIGETNLRNLPERKEGGDQQGEERNRVPGEGLCHEDLIGDSDPMNGFIIECFETVKKHDQRLYLKLLSMIEQAAAEAGQGGKKNQSNSQK